MIEWLFEFFWEVSLLNVKKILKNIYLVGIKKIIKIEKFFNRVIKQ